VAFALVRLLLRVREVAMSSTAVIDHYLRRQMPDIGEVVADALPAFVLFVLGGAH
jgi:hypothetical protein